MAALQFAVNMSLNQMWMSVAKPSGAGLVAPGEKRI
jgi:hypothetical protein